MWWNAKTHTPKKKKIYSILWLSINLNPKPQVKVNLLWKCILCFRCTIPSIDFMTNAFTDSGSFHLNTLICWMVFRSSFQLNVVYHYMSFLQRARIYLFRSHHPFGKSDIWTVCIYRLKPMSITSRFERKNNWLLVEICLWFVIASNNYIIYVYNAKPRLCLLSLSRIILRVFDQFAHSVSLSYLFSICTYCYFPFIFFYDEMSDFNVGAHKNAVLLHRINKSSWTTNGLRLTHFCHRFICKI